MCVVDTIRAVYEMYVKVNRNITIRLYNHAGTIPMCDYCHEINEVNVQLSKINLYPEYPGNSCSQDESSFIQFIKKITPRADGPNNIKTQLE